MNDIAVFIHELYQRMNVWEQRNQDTQHRRLSAIGETRWWAKDVALKKIFGSFGKPDQALYIDVLMTLSVFRGQATLKTAVRVKARGFLEALMRCETVLTAQLFLRIFEVTTPLSKYLQSQGLDILTAHRMVMATQDTMKDMARAFLSVKQAADNFVQWANTQLMVEEDCELELEAELPQKKEEEKEEDGWRNDVMRLSQIQKELHSIPTWPFLIQETLLKWHQVLCLILPFKNLANACSGLTAEQQLSICSLS